MIMSYIPFPEIYPSINKKLWVLFPVIVKHLFDHTALGYRRDRRNINTAMENAFSHLCIIISFDWYQGIIILVQYVFTFLQKIDLNVFQHYEIIFGMSYAVRNIDCI